MHTIPCPHCSTPLRFRDTSQRGRVIACPACSGSICIEEQGGQLVVRSAATVELPQSAPLCAPISFGLLFLIVGSVVGLVIAYFFLIKAPEDAVTAESRLPPPHTAKPEQANSDEPDERPGTSSPRNVTDLPSQERFRKIHSLVERYLLEQGVFPNGQMGREHEKRPADFSWIADLERMQSVDGFVISAERPWNDPVNESFVRRRLELFQNPQLPETVGTDRYPTTHFAGLTGIGIDAEVLPRKHPRAGIFSRYSPTRREDIIDGTAHTIMVVGVTQQLGSWARPGEATLRSFSQEPYVNGPDGLGTGEQESMQVLMADGSVRTVSVQTDPVIARRMAAIADGLPLTMQRPGDPLTMLVPLQSTNPPEMAVIQANDAPIEPLLTPEPPAFDIQKSLALKILSYQLEKPTALSVLLPELEELAGVPINWKDLDESDLNQVVTLQAEKISLLQLLEMLAAEANLRIQIEPYAIVLKQQREAGLE